MPSGPPPLDSRAVVLDVLAGAAADLGADARHWEVRWFVPGELPEHAPVRRRPERRTDRYHLPSLRPDGSLKRRGGGGLEQKWRAEARKVRGGGGLVSVERWTKERVGGDVGGTKARSWIPVAKAIWRSRGLQVAQVELHGEPWWTVAVRPRRRMPDAVAELVEEAAAHGRSQAYPSWLLERCS